MAVRRRLPREAREARDCVSIARLTGFRAKGFFKGLGFRAYEV